MKWIIRALPLVIMFSVLQQAAPAFAAFPGTNGMLAVQPQTGGGIVLVGANGSGARRICTARCGAPRRPRWSPDGRALVFAGPGIRIVYPDGSCMNCQFGAAPNPAFKPGSAVISFIQYGQVKLDGIDGIRQASNFRDSADDAVWSAGGLLAVVHRHSIWAGRPGRLRRLGAGSEPSWSPDGASIAASQDGWIVVLGAGNRPARRLVRGAAPAYSPDGQFIAFVAPDHRLKVLATHGRQPAVHAVGMVRAVSVDWQPRPRGPNPGCPVPPGARTLASSSAALVIGDGVQPPLGFSSAPPLSYMGCLHADGRQRLLEKIEDNNVDSASSVGSAVLAAPYAALVEDWQDEHYGEWSSIVKVFDLRSGLRQDRLGGEQVSCDAGGCSYPVTFGPVVLGSDGASAAHIHDIYAPGALSTPISTVSCPDPTLCLATAGFGTVLSSVNPAGGAAAWTAATVARPPLPGPSALTCPSASLCVGVSSDVYTSTDPAGGAGAWTSTTLPGPEHAMDSVSCPSTTLCVASRVDGAVATSANPTGGASAWSIAQIDRNAVLNAVFCSALPECFLTDSSQKVLTSTQPTGGASAWTASPTTPAFRAGTCPTTSLCLAVNGNDIFTTTAPTAGSWARTTVTGRLNAITCPSASLCLAVGAAGALYVSTDPASGRWSSTTIDAGRDLYSVSCPSASLCVAGDSVGHVVTSTDPTGGSSAWTPALVDGDPCADTTPCSAEQIVASAGTGVHTVDSSKLPGDGPFLTGLALRGNVLTWNHDGTSRTATLR